VVVPFSADASPRETSSRASASVTGISRATATIIRHGRDTGQPGSLLITESSVEYTEFCATPSQRTLSRRHGFVAESHGLEIYSTRLADDPRDRSLVGAIVDASLSILGKRLGHLLALYASFFLFMGATDLLREAGFAAIFVVATAARG